MNSNSITSYTPVTGSNSGRIVYENGLKIEFHTFPLNALVKDLSGMYRKEINLYLRFDTAITLCSATYPSGVPGVTTDLLRENSVITKIRLVSNANVVNGYINWLVIGS